MFEGRGRAGAACSKLVHKVSSHIRPLEFKVESDALLEFRILNLSAFSWWSSGPYSAMSIYGMSQEWKWAPPRKTEAAMSEDWTGLSKRSFCQRSPPGHFHVHILVMLSIRNTFQFNIWQWFPLPLPPSSQGVLQMSTNLPRRLHRAAYTSWYLDGGQGLKSS